MGRQIPFIKAIMLNSWRQRTWKNLFLFFIHIYNIYFESQRKLHSQIKKKKLCSLCTIRWSEFLFSYTRQKIKTCFVQMKFEINLLCLFTENKELKLNAFSFQYSHLQCTCIRKKDGRIVWYHYYCQFTVMLLQKTKVCCQSHTNSILKRYKEYQRAMFCYQSYFQNRIFFKM